jgi:hypothetical protein
MTSADYGILFGFYFVNYFVIVFFNSGLVACANICLSGGHTTLHDGLSTAWSRIGRIFMWSLVAASLGMILRIIEDRRWPTQAVFWLEWGSSTAGQSPPAARSRFFAAHSHSISPPVLHCPSRTAENCSTPSLLYLTYPTQAKRRLEWATRRLTSEQPCPIRPQHNNTESGYADPEGNTLAIKQPSGPPS